MNERRHSDQARAFKPEDKCAVLDAHIEKQNVSSGHGRSFRIRHVQGRVKFDCSYEKGGHVTGEATLTNCD